MKNERLKLTDLKVKSFITELNKKEFNTIAGRGDTAEPTVNGQECPGGPADNDGDPIKKLTNGWSFFCEHDASNICGKTGPLV